VRATFFPDAGLPDGIFQTKNPNFGKFWRAFKWKMLKYLMAIGIHYGHFGIFYGYLVSLW
jgi:hypothetical protein